MPHKQSLAYQHRFWKDLNWLFKNQRLLEISLWSSGQDLALSLPRTKRYDQKKKEHYSYRLKATLVTSLHLNDLLAGPTSKYSQTGG